MIQDSGQNLLSAQKASFKLLFKFSSLDSWHNEDKRRQKTIFLLSVQIDKFKVRFQTNSIPFQADWQVLKWQNSWQVKVDYFRQEDPNKFQILSRFHFSKLPRLLFKYPSQIIVTVQILLFILLFKFYINHPSNL